MKFNIGETAPPPLSPLSESELMHNWKSSLPLVSVLIASYQYSKFIEDALNGILAQKTTFPFEIIIRDDASTDGTIEIINSYKKKYPFIIKTIIEPYNSYPRIKSFSRWSQKSSGKYYAYCEGDDYWIDPYKLEKQVEIFSKNPNITSVTSGQIDIENEIIIDVKKVGGTRTLMHPSNIKIPVNRQEYIYFVDTYRKTILNKHGKNYCISDLMGVWRKHHNGEFGSLLNRDTTLLQYKRATTQFWIGNYFVEEGEKAKAISEICLSIDTMIDAHSELKKEIRLKLIKKWIIPKKMIKKLKKIKRKIFKIFKQKIFG